LTLNTLVLSQPDERLEDLAYDIARAVWQLKDRLKRLARIRGFPTQLVEDHAGQSRTLRTIGDLTNHKKHGQYASKSCPVINIVEFDLRSNGPIEYWYSGASKESTVLVTRPEPIPFSIPVYSTTTAYRSGIHDPSTISEIGKANDLLRTALLEWVPILDQLQALHDSDSNPESVWLKQSLDSLTSDYWRQ
jgi:hypothetical protein